MHARHAIVHAAPPRRICMPGIACAQHIVQRRPHRLPRIAVRRQIINPCPQLILRMIRHHPQIISARLTQHPRRELVPLQRLHLMRQRHRILALIERHRLPIAHAVHRDIGRNVVPLRQVQLKEHQLRLAARELKPKPVRCLLKSGFLQRRHRDSRQRKVGRIIGRTKDRLLQPNSLRILPPVIRLHFYRRIRRPRHHPHL